MRKVIKLIILIIISSSVYFIYQKTNNSNYTIMSIGDSLSLGINSYGIKEFSYIDYLKTYQEQENNHVQIINKYSKRDLSIKETLQLIKNNNEIKRNLSNINNLIITLGYNDLLYEINIEENINSNKLDKIIKNISSNYEELVKEIRKYYKNDIIVVGYYASNKDDYYLNKGIIKLNDFLKQNSNIIYIDTYNLLDNRKKYFSNPNSYYPNREGYLAIANKIIGKTLEKKKNV